MSARRLLFVGHQDPLGRSSGSLLRFLGIGQGLAQAGEVDYLQRRGRSWSSPGAVVRHPQIPPSLPFSEWTQVAALGVPHRLKPALRYPWGLSAMIAPQHARPLLAARYPRISQRALRAARLDVDRYDLIWFFQLETILAFWPLFASSAVPCVADVDDLSSADRDEPTSSFDDRSHGTVTRVRSAIDRRIDSFDRRAWERWRDKVFRHADTVVLSNPEEATGVTARRVRIVPNGFDVPARTELRRAASPPVLTFVGGMHYFPNGDAARFFVRDVVPILRAELGDGFEVRLVGEAPPSIGELGCEPNVTVTGYVQDMASELARADVMIVPLRHGSGTRLKILEAFANMMPVVSTTIGASGLDVCDGEHLLIADSPADFAGACTRLARDATLRKRLADAGYDLVSARYDWPVIARDIETVVNETISGHAPV